MVCDFKGIGVALVTPFAADGMVDYNALGRLVDHVVAGGVDYLVALGTTAETSTLTPFERDAISRFIIARNAGRVPLVIGMGGNDTVRLCEQLRAFDPVGFSAVLSVTPYYNKPTQEGLYRHYKAVAESSPLPVILYNVPSRTGVNMSAETTLRIAREIPNVCGVKEACGQMEQMEQIVNGAPQGFTVLSGDDTATLPLMAIGGDGVISVAANAFPAKFCAMVRAAKRDGGAEADKMWDDFEDVCQMLFEQGNPAGIKGALAAKGICRPDVRLPLVEASESLRSRLQRVILEKSLH